MVQLLVLVVLCAAWYISQYYSGKRLYETVSKIWRECDRTLFAIIDNAALSCGVAKPYRIDGSEWAAVAVILTGFRQDLAGLFFSGELHIPREYKDLRREKERANRLFGNTLPDRVFLYLLRNYLMEHECDFTFLDVDMVAPSAEHGVFPMTEFSVVFHKLLNISHHFCCTETAFNFPGQDTDRIEKELEKREKEL